MIVCTDLRLQIMSGTSSLTYESVHAAMRGFIWTFHMLLQAQVKDKDKHCMPPGACSAWGSGPVIGQACLHNRIILCSSQCVQVSWQRCHWECPVLASLQAARLTYHSLLLSSTRCGILTAAYCLACNCRCAADTTAIAHTCNLCHTCEAI